MRLLSFSSRRRHTSSYGGWSSDVCSSDLIDGEVLRQAMACGTAMASLAIEAFSPERLVETSPVEIEGRVGELHGLVRSEERRVGKEGGAGRALSQVGKYNHSEWLGRRLCD